MAPKRKLRKEDVDKVTALEVLKKKRMTVLEFADALRHCGKHVPGPRKAYNVLSRLQAQGLTRREESSRDVSYTMDVKGESRQVERSARVVYWSLTGKGQDRLKYLLTRDRR